MIVKTPNRQGLFMYLVTVGLTVSLNAVQDA